VDQNRGEEHLRAIAEERFDLVLSGLAFDNIPTVEGERRLLVRPGALLAREGLLVNLVSAPAIHTHGWASFTTPECPENGAAETDDVVRIVMLDVPDRRPVEDVLCTDSAHRAAYRDASLALRDVHRPLGRADELRAWVSETEVSPLAIYLLGPDRPRPGRPGAPPETRRAGAS
jgi:hypothetical protein